MCQLVQLGAPAFESIAQTGGGAFRIIGPPYRRPFNQSRDDDPEHYTQNEEWYSASARCGFGLGRGIGSGGTGRLGLFFRHTRFLGSVDQWLPIGEELIDIPEAGVLNFLYDAG